MNPAPIVLFVYNRPDHTRRTVEALKRNQLADQSDLYIYSDGPKKAEHKDAVGEVRKYIHSISGFKSVKVLESDENLGLANSIIRGVTEIVNQFGKIIVLEDDMVTSTYFLEYMNTGLRLYESDDKVASIHGYIYPVNGKLPETFFIKGADCWGWATWKRAWDIFERDGSKLLHELESRNLIREFDFDGSYPFSNMLKAQIAGKNNSWAIRWYASAFLKGKLTLYPSRSLVYNTGFDGSGTHSGQKSSVNATANIENVQIDIQRIAINEDMEAKRCMINYFMTQKESMFSKARRILLTLVKKAR